MDNSGEQEASEEENSDAENRIWDGKEKLRGNQDESAKDAKPKLPLNKKYRSKQKVSTYMYVIMFPKSHLRKYRDIIKRARTVVSV